MLDRELLSRHKDTLAEQRDIQRRINESGSLNISMAERMALIQQLEFCIRKCDKEILEVEKTIQEIEEPRMRQMFRYKYIDGLRWQEIAWKMHGTPESVRKEHDRFLAKQK